MLDNACTHYTSKKILLAGLIFLVFQIFFLKVFAQTPFVPVFIAGKEGHKIYRIPAIIKLPNENLLAFCEGRVNDAEDFGDINIVMKTSKDNGKTWGVLQKIVDYEKLQAGNPAPVLDITDPLYPNGRIFLFYNTGNNTELEVRKGNGIRQVFYKTSVDGGNTWSESIDITLQTHRPNQPGINPLYNFKEDWRSYANTPGHAMQFLQGKYKGRIFIAANHSSGSPLDNSDDYKAHGFYTDDHGKSFRLSSQIQLPGSNESMAAELSNNKLMMNSRNQKGDVRARIISISSDGGANWDSTYFDNNLPDPVNQGSLLNIGVKKGKALLAFCNAADTKQRDNLTLRISFDEGKTWQKKILIARSNQGYDGDISAYSDLVKIKKKKIGILYERDDYTEIVFTIADWK